MELEREELLIFLAKELPQLLIERPEVRYELIGILAETFVRRDEQREILNAIQKILERLEEHGRILQEHGRMLQEHSRMLQEHSRILQEHTRVLQEHTQAIHGLMKQQQTLTEEVVKMGKTISAIGTRWGVLAEEAFRDALRAILERELGLTVQKWRHLDTDGVVFSHPDWVEVDVVIRDEKHILVQIAASATRSDVAGLYRIGQLYEQLYGVKPHLMIVTVFMDERAQTLAAKLGVQVRMG